MTKTERAKAQALDRCHLGDWHGDREFVRGMVWLARHSPEIHLAPKQKWYLDALLWRYRKQLAGRVHTFELPTARPESADYEPKRRRMPVQRALI